MIRAILLMVALSILATAHPVFGTPVEIDVVFDTEDSFEYSSTKGTLRWERGVFNRKQLIYTTFPSR